MALVLALMASAVLAVTTSALVLSATANQGSSYKSSNARHAFALARTSLAYAEGMLFAYAKGLTATAPTAGQVHNLPAQAGGGKGTYWASPLGDGVTWRMYGTGTYGGITRTVSAEANVPSPQTYVQSGVWNYVYSDTTGTTCGTTLNANVTISVPLMIHGDLCLSGSLRFAGSQLEVGGNLSVTGSAKIGTSGSRISTLRVGLTSTSANTCQSVTPGTGACDGAHSPIYASSVAKGMDITPEMPCIGQPSSYDSLCTGSNDGTWTTLHSTYNAQAAATKSGTCPANLFDNNSTLDNSDTSITSVMFGSTAYDCTFTTSQANEISWTPSTHTLRVSGALYFDGSLTLTGNVTYSGQASMYFTGGIGTTGSPTLCGIDSQGNPDNCSSSWDTDTSGIIFVAGCWANSTGSSLLTSNCVSLGGGTTIQVGVYCTTQYTTAGGSSNMGPVLANSLNLGGGAQTLMPFHWFPPGTPLNTSTVYFPSGNATHWSG